MYKYSIKLNHLILKDFSHLNDDEDIKKMVGIFPLDADFVHSQVVSLPELIAMSLPRYIIVLEFKEYSRFVVSLQLFMTNVEVIHRKFFSVNIHFILLFNLLICK